MGPQHLAPGTAGLEVKGGDGGQSKAAGRHGVALGFLVLVKRDLHARDPGQVPHLRHERGRRMAIARTVRPEQHDAVSVARVLIGEAPAPLLVEAHERIDPAGPIEVRPLIAHAQMHLDHATADGLGVEDAGVALEMPADPRAAIRLDAGIVRGVHGPMIEGAFPAGFSVAWRHQRGSPSTTATSELTWRPSKSVIHMCPGVRLASYSACEESTRLATPMPLRLMMGLENTGNRGGGTPCGPASRPWLNAIAILS